MNLHTTPTFIAAGISITKAGQAGQCQYRGMVHSLWQKRLAQPGSRT